MRIPIPKVRTQTVSPSPETLIDFVIITALEDERKAVCREFNLTDADRVDTGARRYWRGRVQLPNDEYYEIVVAQLSDMANMDASILTKDAIIDWDPGALLLVGIAAGINDDVDLGDVVIASDIYYYERAKITSTGEKLEPKIYRTDQLLWNKVITTSEWKPRLRHSRPDRSRKKPKVHRGVIASGEKVIAEQAARDAIARGHRKIIAIEMEGYGFSAAIFQSPHQLRHLVIKAISDRADQKKGDDWHQYAATAAAAYTKHFLLDRPLEPRNSSNEIPPDQVAQEILREQQQRRNIQQQGRDLLDQILPDLEIGRREPGLQSSQAKGSYGPLGFPISTENQYRSDNPFEAIGPQIEGLMAVLSDAVSQERLKQLERLRELYREGKIQVAKQEINALRQDASWHFLNSSVKIRILRLIAVFNLNSEQPDISEARGVANDMAAIDPESEDLALVKAFLINHEKGPDKALEELGKVTNIDLYNLRINLLISSNRVEQALEELENPLEGITQDNETKRLHALALLMVGDLGQARTVIEEVLNRRVEWDYARWAGAIIYYYSGLSPALRFKPYISWPQPVDWSLIKETATGISYLRKAEKEFARLASETERGEEHQKVIQTWRLACLSNDRERQDEASDFCRTLLDKDPANHRALAWAMTRKFEIDASLCETALEYYIKENKDVVSPSKAEKVLALTGIYLEKGDLLAATELLESTRENFIKIGNKSIWVFWKAQVLIVNGTPEKALDLCDGEIDSSIQRSIRTMALRSIGLRSGNWGEFIKHLEESFKITHSGIYLLELCQLKFDFKEWNYVADRAFDLVKVINTTEAFRLSVFACWSEKRIQLCLHLLEDYKTSLGAERLPSDLWRIQVCCQATIDLSAALSNAGELAHLDPATENLLLLIDMHHRMGDLKGAALIARELNSRDDVAPRDLLWIAKWIYLEHRELAIVFWHRAKDKVLGDPDLLGYTIILGTTLGLDKETGPLFGKMQEYISVGRGPFKAFSLDKLFEWKKERDEYLRFVYQNYEKGSLPLHVIVSEIGLTLAEILHRIPAENRMSFNGASAKRIFIRHGGRPLVRSLAESLSDRLLYLDITAILVAEDLGILEKAERCFGPLHISSETPRALSHQRLELMSQQPSRLRMFERVLDLLEKKKPDQFSYDIKPSDDLYELVKEMGERWVAILLKAHQEDALIVDYLPLRSHDQKHAPIVFPHQFRDNITNCRAIVESLKNNGGLSISSYEKALVDLGSEREQNEQAVIPQIGAKLFLVGNIIEFLISTNLIDLICERFQISLDPRYIDEARATVQENVRRNEVASWLEKLTNRINSGLTNGIYKAVNRSEVLKEVTKHEDTMNLEFMAATELLRYKVSEKDVLWFDDRHLNSYSSRDQVVPIIGISEVLEALHLRGELSVQEHYEIVLKLRKSNYRYIPITEGEIFHHLQQAQTEPTGRLIETSELSILRQYFASCFLDPESLQKPPMPEGFPNVSGEMAFISQTTQAITDALIEVWADETADIKTTIARSEWLLNNLYTGLSGLIHLVPNPELRGDALNELGMDIGTLLGAGIAIGARNLRSPMLTDKMRNRRQQYFKWLDRRVVSPRLKADPISIDAAVAFLGTLLMRREGEEFESKEMEDFYRAYQAFFYEDLPDCIKDRMSKHKEVMQWLGIEIREVITVDSYSFNASDYWTAVERVFAEQPATVRALGTDIKFTFRKIQTSEVPDAFEIVDAQGTVIHRFRDPILNLMSPDLICRESLLRSHRFWFNCPHDVFEKEVAEIVAMPDAQIRIDKANTWRRHSAEYFYRNLEEHLTLAKSFLWSQLLPEMPESLLAHFWIEISADDDFNFQHILEKSATAIIEEEGLQAALERLACLPVRFPMKVIELFSQLPIEDKEDSIKKYKSYWSSPLSKIHLIEVVTRSGLGSDQIIELVKNCLDELVNEQVGEPAFEAFESILQFVNTEFGYLTEVQTWPASINLALVWAHASRLHNIFNKAGATSEDLIRLFPPSGQPMDTDILARVPTYWNDVLHPHRLSRAVFLTHGVASILTGIDEQLLKDISADEIIGKFAFAADARDNLIQLMRDPTLALNGTDSFLGGDRAEVLSTLFVQESLNVLSASSLEGMVAQALQELKADQNKPVWGSIQAIVGDLPIYSKLKKPLEGLLEKLDIKLLLERDPILAYYSQRIATNQTPYFSSESLRENIENNLLDMAAYYSDKPSNNTVIDESQDKDQGQSNERIITSLLELGLNVSLRLNDPRATTNAWSQLLRRMFIAWPDLATYAGGSFLQLVFELPTSQLHGLWLVVLYLRASRQNAL